MRRWRKLAKQGSGEGLEHLQSTSENTLVPFKMQTSVICVDAQNLIVCMYQLNILWLKISESMHVT